MNYIADPESDERTIWLLLKDVIIQIIDLQNEKEYTRDIVVCVNIHNQ